MPRNEIQEEPKEENKLKLIEKTEEKNKEYVNDLPIKKLTNSKFTTLWLATVRFFKYEFLKFQNPIDCCIVCMKMKSTVIRFYIMPLIDRKFKIGESGYNWEKEKIYETNLKYPISFYNQDHPLPLEFQQSKLKSVDSGHIKQFLEYEGLAKLIKGTEGGFLEGKVKWMMILIVIGAIILVILQLTGVINLGDLTKR